MKGQIGAVLVLLNIYMEGRGVRGTCISAPSAKIASSAQYARQLGAYSIFLNHEQKTCRLREQLFIKVIHINIYIPLIRI